MTMSIRAVPILGMAMIFAALSGSRLVAQRLPDDGPVNQYGNTLKRTPRPTTAAITEDDLKTRLYIFADDSMMGRQAGRVGNMKGTEYIASELRRLGLEPAGDNGTYFQGLPYYRRFYTAESQLSAGSQPLRFGTDFIPVPVQGRPPVQDLNSVQVIYGGVLGDTTFQITAAQATGRIVVFTTQMTAATRRLADARAAAAQGTPPVRVSGTLQVNDQTVTVLTQGTNAAAAADSVRVAVLGAVGGRGGAGGRGAGAGAGAAGGGGRGGRGGGAAGGAVASRFANAAAIVTVDLEALSAAQRENLTNPSAATYSPGAGATVQPGAVLGNAAAPVSIHVTNAAAGVLMGVPLDSLVPGSAGRIVRGRLVFEDRHTPEWGRNVVAILRGSDPVLRDEYVSIGAHNDHTGFAQSAVDHDSLKAHFDALMKMRIRGRDSLLNASVEMVSSIRVNVDSLRRIRPARPDSINNGADDDGSGSMAVLEIAEALALAPQKPRRSVLFVWHTAEESGLLGSAFYAANPTVPREAIVANINMDMVGRGRAEDIPGGGEGYVAVLGADRLSTDLGRMVEQANRAQRRPLRLDYRFDSTTTWGGYNNLYGRSDHANYSRYGIPIAFFFTGLHGDYHQRTDEAQYINYPNYTRITNYVRDLMLMIANAPNRPRVDRPGNN